MIMIMMKMIMVMMVMKMVMVFMSGRYLREQE